MRVWLAMCPECYSKEWEVREYIWQKLLWVLGCMQCSWVGFANELVRENSLSAVSEQGLEI